MSGCQGLSKSRHPSTESFFLICAEPPDLNFSSPNPKVCSASKHFLQTKVMANIAQRHIITECYVRRKIIV